MLEALCQNRLFYSSQMASSCLFNLNEFIYSYSLFWWDFAVSAVKHIDTLYKPDKDSNLIYISDQLLQYL